MILTELYENLLQAQNINGTLLAGGKVYVYYLGRSQLADTWTDIDGESLNTNPIILDNQGMCKCYVDTSYDYTVVVKDRFDQLVFARDKHVATDGKTQGGAAGTIIQGSNNITVNHTIVNEKDVYTISGKDYEGVDPIVVDNDLRRISANTVTFGVREPLYFVQDDDQATIIGMSGDVAYKEWVTDNFYSVSNPSAFVTSGELSTVSADITAMIPTALTGDYLTKESADTLYYGINNPSSFVTSGDVSAYLVQSDWSQTASTEPDYIKNKPTETTLSAGDGISIVETGNYVVISNTNSGDAEVNELVHSASGMWNSVSSKLDQTSADTLYYPLNSNPNGYLTAETNWTDTITAASANAYNQATAAIPTGLATESFVTSQGYITNDAIIGKQDISGMTAYPQISAISSYSGDISTISSTVNDITAQLDSAYSFVAGSGISLTDNTANKTTTINVTAQGGNTAVEQLVINSSGTWNSVSSMLDKASADTLYQPIGNYQTAGDYLTTGDSANFYTTANESGFATTALVSSVSAEVISSLTSADYELVAGSGISIVDDSTAKTTTISVTAQGGNTAVEQLVISSSGTWNTVSSKLDKASADTLYQPIGNYQTAGDYLTTGDSANFYTTANESGFATTSQLQTVSGDITGLIPTDLFTKASADTLYQPIGNYQTAGDYLTTGDSANFYTTANDSGFITTASQTVTSTAGDGTYVTAINGMGISAQGCDVPEGVMAESGLEYNAVNEISGYNGSAIAQYGAEKQFIVHDDTLVHLSNSAQYALGCNISALQRLMGIDETVLYNNTAATTADVAIGSTFDISEPITNFNKFKIYFSRFSVDSTGNSNGGPCSQIREYDSTACSAYFVINETFPTSTASNTDWFDISMLIETISGNTWKCKACYQSKLPSGSLDKGWKYLKPYKVIGIGRRN